MQLQGLKRNREIYAYFISFIELMLRAIHGSIFKHHLFPSEFWIFQILGGHLKAITINKPANGIISMIIVLYNCVFMEYFLSKSL